MPLSMNITHWDTKVVFEIQHFFTLFLSISSLCKLIKMCFISRYLTNWFKTHWNCNLNNIFKQLEEWCFWGFVSVLCRCVYMSRHVCVHVCWFGGMCTHTFWKQQYIIVKTFPNVCLYKILSPPYFKEWLLSSVLFFLCTYICLVIY